MYSTKEKLKAEYAGKAGLEIRDLRRAGVEVTDTVEVPEVAFTGDTTSDWITNAGGDPRPRILQLVQAHERSTGAHMPAAAIPPAYQSAFGEPLPLREGQKLRDLLKAVHGVMAYQPPGKPHWMVMAC